jgi:hypothetical protein
MDHCAANVAAVVAPLDVRDAGQSGGIEVFDGCRQQLAANFAGSSRSSTINRL